MQFVILSEAKDPAAKRRDSSVAKTAPSRRPGALRGSDIFIYLRHIRRRVHYYEFAIRIACHRKFKLRNGRHLGFVRAAARTEHEQAPVRIAEFYLKDIGVADLLLKCCRTYFETSEKLVVASPRPQGEMIVGINIRSEAL